MRDEAIRLTARVDRESLSKIKPVATGGITSGRVTKVSTTDLPSQRGRASNHAIASPKGKMSSVLPAQAASVNRTACHSSGCTGECCPRRDREHKRSSSIDS